MKRILFFVALFIALHSSFAEDILYSWDFATEGNSEGWRPTHDLTAFSVIGGVLKTTSTGADPYMHGPSVNIDAAKYSYLKVKMKVSAGSSAEFFWTLQGMAGEQAGYEQPFTLTADNHFHEYLVYVGKHDKWKGKVIRLRLDPTTVSGAKIEIDYIQVLSLGPRLEIKNLGADVLLPKTGELFNMGCEIENTGDKDVQAISSRIVLPDGLELQNADTSQVKDSLSPGEKYEFHWPVKTTAPGNYAASVNITAANLPDTLRAHVSVNVESPLSDLPPEIPNEVQAFQYNPHFWILQNARVRLVFSDLQYFRLFVAKNEEWFLIGASRPISRIEYQLDGLQYSVPLLADSLSILYSSPDSVMLALTGRYSDSGGGIWSFQFRFGLGRGKSHLTTAYQLSCSQERELAQFTGPSIYLGEGSFADQFDEAILPGLEWLVKGEHSSSTLDAHPPINLRFAPNPLKISAPIMAVNSDSITAGIIWNPQQKWDGVHTHPAIEFSVPNWLEGQKNHKLGMMLPSIPDYVAENLSQPTKPYALKPDQKISMNAKLYAFNSTSALDAFDYYFKVSGPPTLQPMARPLDDEMALCRAGFQTVWNESKKGWQHAMGSNWSHQPYPGYAFLQYFDSILSDNPNIRENLQNRVKTVEKKILRNSGEAGLASRGGCHIAGWQFPFYVGHLDGALAGMKSEPTAILFSQTADGGWPFKGNAELGERGKYELGTCAHNTFLLLYYYQISGDKTYFDAAIKALDFMQQFKVPRGAQTWEVPLHTPDILAAAHAVRAYTTAYKITQNETYLQQARYWARAGLPFVYFWADPDIVTMPFATIPVMGATFYTHSWFGIPVQWNGLVYSHALFELAKVDPEQPLWRTVAEGITRSAMYQQVAEGERVGTYPDSWNLFTNSPQPVYINPEDIIKNVLFLAGHDPELDNVIVSAGVKTIHITSAAKIQNVHLDTLEHTLQFQGDFFPGDTCYVLIAGVRKVPSQIIINDASLNHVADVDDNQQGWQYSFNNYVIIKVVQPGEEPLSIKITNLKTSVQRTDENSGAVPARFYLGQNYPNPFNPTTTIEFSVKEKCRVLLKVFDVRGREVTTLVDAVRAPGTFKIDFDAHALPSGMYFYRIKMKDYEAVKKMILLE
ncbi:MAG: T9SS type A sorting domain-containing protein [Actinobacteria bacterium]|nr:T9SS type A sorting domain-containing protein [Actinomycetota bacterium]